MVNLINNNKNILEISRSTKDYSYTPIWRSNREYEIKLEKASFRNSYKRFSGYIKMSACNSASGETSKYYVKKAEIIDECGIRKEKAKNMSSAACEQRLFKYQTEGTLQDIFKIYSRYEGKANNFDKIVELVEKKAISAQKLKYILSRIKKIKNPPKRNQVIQRVFNTLFTAADNWGDGIAYHGKVHHIDEIGKRDILSYSYMIDKEGQLSIFRSPHAGGSAKQVSKRYCFSNSETKKVKIAIRGNMNISSFSREQMKKEGLESPYIHNPEIEMVTDTTLTKYGRKYIYLEDQMDGNGWSIPKENIKRQAQFILDFGRGLAYLHKNGILHGDVKPDNGLIIGDRAKICDFETAAKLGEYMQGGTDFYYPPERLNLGLHKVGSFSYDIYSYGVLILELLAPGYCDQLFGKVKRFSDLTLTQRKKYFENLSTCSLNPSKEEIIKFQLIKLAEKLTSTDPKDRSSSSNDPNFQKGIENTVKQMEELFKQVSIGVDLSDPT